MTDQGTTIEPAPPADRAPAPVGRFRADIQGMRAVAVLVVVLFHAGLGFPGGFVGVDVFFVISGFVITGMLVAERQGSGRLRLGRFYLRRIRRLLPALAVLLVTVLALAPLLGPRSTGAVTARTGIAGALFAANVQLVTSFQGYFDPRSGANPFLHLWTLSVEEQFYLVFPLLLIGATWLAARRTRPAGADADAGAVTGAGAGSVTGATVLAVLGAAAALSLALAWALAGRHVPGIGDTATRIAFYSAPTRAWEFLAGALLALVVARGWTPSAGAAEVAGWGGLALLAVAVLAFDEGTAFPMPTGVVPVVAAGLLLVAGTGRSSRVSRALAAPPGRWLGDRSYGWYLWHWPLIVFAGALFPDAGWAAPAAAAVSLLPAWLSYRHVEQPVRARPPRPVPTLLLGAACVALPIVVGLASVPLRTALDRDPAVQAMDHALRAHLDRARRCSTGEAHPATRAECTWAAPGGGRGSTVLLGDSNAGHLSEGFVAAAGSLHLDATVQTRSGCPFADLTVRRAGVVDEGCRRYYQDQMALLAAHPPAVVVLASAADLHVLADDVAFAGPGPGSGPARVRWATTADAKLDRWRRGLARTVADLDRLGIGVVVVEPVPRFTGWQAPSECARLRVMVDEPGCGTARATADTRPLGDRVTEADGEAVAGRPRATLLEVSPGLCPGPTCHTYQDGAWVFRDESHLTVDASRDLAPVVASAMQGVLPAGW